METRGALRSSPLPERPLVGASSRRGRPARSGRPGRARRWGGRGGVWGERRGPRPRPPARAAVCGWVPRRYRAVLPRAPWDRGRGVLPVAALPRLLLPVRPAAPRAAEASGGPGRAVAATARAVAVGAAPLGRRGVPPRCRAPGRPWRAGRVPGGPSPGAPPCACVGPCSGLGLWSVGGGRPPVRAVPCRVAARWVCDLRSDVATR